MPPKIRKSPAPHGPLAPSPPSAAGQPDQKSFERKAAPDGLVAPQGESDGYDSERDDLAPDYYHGQWRSRDRKKIADPSERKRRRDLAQGWDFDPEALSIPAQFIRGKSNQYSQKAGHCLMACYSFYYLRRSGMTTQAAIAELDSSWFNKGLPLLHAEYAKLRQPTAGSALFSTVFTTIMRRLQRNHSYAKLSPSTGKPIHRADIFFGTLIGCYPRRQYPEAERTVQFSAGKNAVSFVCHQQPMAPATTMQASLFAGYQAPRATTIPLARSWTGTVPTAERVATPFVLLRMSWPTGKMDGAKELTAAHGIIVDFTNPEHPGIFDPNFGWMEPAQGFCFLSFERALNSLWEHYTGHNRSNNVQGVKHHSEIAPKIAFNAIQLYEQVM